MLKILQIICFIFCSKICLSLHFVPGEGRSSSIVILSAGTGGWVGWDISHNEEGLLQGKEFQLSYTTHSNKYKMQ